MEKYVFERRDGDWSEPVSYSAAMQVARERIKSGAGPFVITQDGTQIGAATMRSKTLSKLERRLEIIDIGPVFRVRDRSGRVVYKVRRVEDAINIIDTNGNDKADLFWSLLRAEFPNARFAGAYVCKYISGSSQLSQHSYGNAVDAFPGAGETLEGMARWAIDSAAVTSAQTIIWTNKIWRRGSGISAYSGEYHGHLHEDFTPEQFGSCGVKG